MESLADGRGGLQLTDERLNLHADLLPGTEVKQALDLSSLGRVAFLSATWRVNPRKSLRLALVWAGLPSWMQDAKQNRRADARLREL